MYISVLVCTARTSRTCLACASVFVLRVHVFLSVSESLPRNQASFFDVTSLFPIFRRKKKFYKVSEIHVFVLMCVRMYLCLCLGAGLCLYLCLLCFFVSMSIAFYMSVFASVCVFALFVHACVRVWWVQVKGLMGKGVSHVACGLNHSAAF